MTHETGYTRDQIEAEIVRCWRLANDENCACRAIYKDRAKRMANAATDVFWHRATYDQISASAALLRDSMRSTPKNQPTPSRAEWEQAWRGARAA